MPVDSSTTFFVVIPLNDYKKFISPILAAKHKAHNMIFTLSPKALPVTHCWHGRHPSVPIYTKMGFQIIWRPRSTVPISRLNWLQVCCLEMQCHSSTSAINFSSWTWLRRKLLCAPVIYADLPSDWWAKAFSRNSFRRPADVATDWTEAGVFSVIGRASSSRFQGGVSALPEWHDSTMDPCSWWGIQIARWQGRSHGLCCKVNGLP